MKYKLTLLNLLVAACLALGLYSFLGAGNVKGLMRTAFLFLAFIFFVTDLVFRLALPHANLKKLWLLQLAFVIFVAVLMLIISKI
ncbi:hypothetical protein [Hufsiella ginkgonis]|uniref:Uncharacterized protein n=1 Tax=Hufsiella ginkgonis TaxID=2695274 RepID=A0A7K1XXE0_9SPHI|nr:hypothetical protein [Hufsiella ginkgonis]MXV15603.1 hypothetical protein [Hufsiella ginkgonis]